MITLQFVLGKGLSSQAIAWFNSGKFSHVDCIFPDGTLLGARSDVILGIPPGVQIRPQGYEEWKIRYKMKLAATPLQEDRFYAFLQSQKGKPYDKTAIWGFAAGRDWREKDSWFCSELQAAALEYAALTPELYSPVNKISPAALALVMSALGAD